MQRIFMRRLTTIIIKRNLLVGHRHDETAFDWIRIAFEYASILHGIRNYNLYSC